ncbi:tetratricopeptide repeat protein [candidate division KSB1 bacterium]|nr:tetratricopeptide repeat protein [candidate division KSB1 bacterium]
MQDFIRKSIITKLNGSVFLLILLLWLISFTQLNAQDSKRDLAELKQIEYAAEKVYREATSLYENGDYWKCSKKLFIIMDFYTEFSKLDEVIYYMGECLYEEEMNDAAQKMFKYLIRKYPDSRFLTKSMFGLQKAGYREEDFKKALTVYYNILKQPKNDNVIDASRYFAGQSHFHLKNYDTAINIFKQVSNNSEYYDGALYSIALCYLKKKGVASSIEYFQKLISLPIISGERRRMVDEARLTLGFIYYQINMYEDAIDLFGDISDVSEGYQDALLAMGWCYLKIGKYEAALKPLLKLIDNFPTSANAEESYFLLGQAYILTGEYDKSIASYQTIVDLFPNNLQNMSIMTKISNTLVTEEDKLEKLKVQILIQESKLLTTLPLNQTSGEMPKYVFKEEKKLDEFRENLISKLMEERENLIYMQNSINDLQKMAERKERRKDWRGYAEYGISRALFLKEMQYRAN